MKQSTIRFSLMVLQTYLFYLKSQRWDRKQIESYQDEQLTKIVKYAAKNVPYYRKLFKEINLDLNEFKGRVDMHKIPLLDKATLRTRQNEFIADNAAKFGINWDSTSGSTGTPLRFIVDDSTQAHELATVLRSYQWAGYSPWKKAFSIQSYTFDRHESTFKRYPFANLWRFDSKQLKRANALQWVEMINSIKPSILIGYPFSILKLSQIAKENALSIHPLHSIITAGETLSNRRRELLQEAYGCQVFDFYSLHELVAIISECSHKRKHLCEDFAYNEIVDESGRLVANNSQGEIVGTGLYNYAMPLIRYKLGDTVVLDDNDTACECGRNFRVVKKIIGRQNDYIETPDGRFLGNVLEHSIDNARGVALSQCVQDAVDHVYVNLIVDDSFNKKSIKAIEKGLRQRLGDEIKIDFELVLELERSKSGKTPFILSKIGHEYV